MRVSHFLRGVPLRAVLGVAAAACPLVAHAAFAAGRWMPLAAALAACQVAAIGLVLLRRTREGRLAWLALAVPAFALAAQVHAQASVLAVSGVSHALIYTGLLALFGGTLRRGRVPLVTGLARRLRGPLKPEMEAYTRGVTVAWCGFCAAQLAASVLLLLLAPTEAWSLFVNVLDAPLVGLMFLSELAVRHLRFRDYDHAGIAETVRAFGQQAAARNQG